MEILHSAANFFAPGRFPTSPIPSIQHSMKAVVMIEHGGPDVLKIVNDFPVPEPAPESRQVVVEIAGSGLNPVDFKMRRGPIANFIYPKPKIIGSDISGKVIMAPVDSYFKPGDRVFAMLPLLGTQYGGYAEKCCMDETILAKAPSSGNLVDLASLPLAICTVVQAFRPIVKAFNGQTRGLKCFVVAGSGGLGSFAIQYASKVLQMDVATSCSGKNRDFVIGLGAIEVVDYTSATVEGRIQDYDVFFDSMGYKHEDLVYSPTSRILKQNYHAHYIRIASSPYDGSMSSDPLGLSIAEARVDRIVGGYWNTFVHHYSPIHYHFVLVHPDREALEEVVPYLESGQIKPVVARRFAMEEVGEAHTLLEGGHVQGKLVLEINPDL
ncbi:NADP-dependent oxidoreductase [archaeon]|nr:MAG: NADP-dependent oxidoreductase [archaeon]